MDDIIIDIRSADLGSDTELDLDYPDVRTG